MTWEIDKTIEFCYGHRVWTQELDPDYTDGDNLCKCRHLHGHQAKVQVFLQGNELDPQGMVTDFKHLGWAKKFFDQYIDHKFIIDSNDPLFHLMTIYEELPMTIVNVPGTNLQAGSIIAVDDMINNTDMGVNNETREYLESFFIVDFIPTSENLSYWAHRCIQEKMSGLDITVSRVDWWETPKSRASFRAM